MGLLISIIIPIYNMEKFLTRCLDSILSQSYSDLEIILINDGSTDKSAQICDAYKAKDSRIAVIHKKNAGVSEARNSGLDIAKGDYISFVDPDDWLAPDTYKVLMQNQQETDADIIRFQAYKSDGSLLNEIPFEGLYDGEKLTNFQLSMVGAPKFGGMFILGVLWLHIYRRSLIEDNHIRFNKDLRRCEDRLFCILAIFEARKISFIKDVLYHYETNEGSLSNRYDPIRWEQELIFLEELQKGYAHKSVDFRSKADRRIKSDYILRAIVSMNNEFFSQNKNSFAFRRKRIATMVNNPKVIDSIKDLEKEKLGTKGDLIFDLIKKRAAFSLTSLLSFILYGGKLKNKIRQ